MAVTEKATAEHTTSLHRQGLAAGQPRSPVSRHCLARIHEWSTRFDPSASAKKSSREDYTLTATTFVQRVNTHGGSAPASGCDSPPDVGKKAFVPYTADYFLYRDAGSN